MVDVLPGQEITRQQRNLWQRLLPAKEAPTINYDETGLMNSIFNN
jgi:hypothetical protein